MDCQYAAAAPDEPTECVRGAVVVVKLPSCYHAEHALDVVVFVSFSLLRSGYPFAQLSPAGDPGE